MICVTSLCLALLSPPSLARGGQCSLVTTRSRDMVCSRRLKEVAMHTAALAVLLATTTATPAAVSGLDALYPQLDALYLDLHQNPELSGKETRTGAKLAERLRSLGYQVTTGVGGTGLVGVLK